MNLKRTFALALIATISTHIGAYEVEQECSGCVPAQRNPLFIKAEKVTDNFNIHLTDCKDKNNCDEHEGFAAILLKSQKMLTKLSLFKEELASKTDGVCHHSEKEEVENHHSIITDLLNSPEAQNILAKTMSVAATALQAELEKAQ